MRTVSDEYLAQVQSSGRQFGVMVKVYGNSAEPDTLWLGDVISVDILRSCSDQLQIGACMSDMLTLETKTTTLFNGRLKKVEVFYRCTAPVLDWVKLGTFYVDEAVTRNGVTAVKAYDMMSRLDKRVCWVDTSKATAPTFPCKMQAMLNYLCARAGVTTDFVCEDITVEKAPDGYTAQELISYIAASHGRNARFSPSEVLKFPAYEEVGKTVQHGRCYSLDIAGGSGYTVKGILLQRGGDDKIYIDGTASEYDETADGIVTAYDPFATVGIAEYAWNRLGGLNYSAVSLEMPAENILEPGDVFTVEGADGTQKKAIVMEQELSLTCTGGFVEKISCTAESKAQNRSTENRQEATEKQVAAGATSATLTEYQYLTDASVKFNGTTYTIEKDAETGLISKISDSAGNEFEPEISAGITDVAAHNAVFWAVAMCRGISKTAFIMDGIFGMFTPDTRDIASLRWKNSVAGYADIVLAGASENGEAVHFTASQYGTFACAEPSTVYAIVKSEVSKVINCIITKRLSQLSNSEHYGFGLLQFDGNLYFSSAAYDIQQTNVSCIEYHVYCFTRVDGVTYFYIDGALVGHVGNCMTGQYANMMYLNNEYLGSTRLDAPTICDFVMCAFGSQYHDEATVRNNSAYLMKKYKIGGNT
jgi:hypothetical protein|nr:MAG TPA: hypothetical protein [Caudoviricetes sp.]